jgi:FAD/FMN-containing dehydrogenase
MNTIDAPVWSQLDAALAGEVILPGDPRMKLANKHFAAGRPLPTPQALIRCRDRDDVRRALAFVQHHELPFSVRSGGHCFSDFSSSAGAIIDLAEVAFCLRDGDGIRVGPGLHSGKLAPALAHVGLAFPTGGCPWVAIGGLCLVGGFGFLGRTFGLATDRVRAIEIVTADGRVLECDAGNDAELFWALRGAGSGGFGIVTSLALRTLPFPSFRACYGMWPIDEAPALIALWQAHFAGADAQVNLEVGVQGADHPDEPCTTTLFGILVGSDHETAAMLEDVRRALGPLASKLRSWTPDRAAAAGYLCGMIDQQGNTAWQPCMPFERSAYQFTRSHFIGEAMTSASIEDCVRHFREQRVYAQVRELEFIPWGGAYAMRDDMASFPHRESSMMVRHAVMMGVNADSALRERSAAWVDGSHAALDRHTDGGVYSGYADWRRPDWERAYYRDAYPRLQRIKARYDPDNVFRHPQSIRLPVAAA